MVRPSNLDGELAIEDPADDGRRELEVHQRGDSEHQQRTDFCVQDWRPVQCEYYREHCRDGTVRP